MRISAVKGLWPASSAAIEDRAGFLGETSKAARAWESTAGESGNNPCMDFVAGMLCIRFEHKLDMHNALAMVAEAPIRSRFFE